MRQLSKLLIKYLKRFNKRYTVNQQDPAFGEFQGMIKEALFGVGLGTIIKGATKIGAGVAAPIAWGIKGTSAVARPILSVAGKAASMGVKGVNSAMGLATKPMVAAGKAAFGTTAALGAAGVGATGKVLGAVGSGVVAPGARAYGRMLQRSPIMGTLGTAYTGSVGAGAISKYRGTNYLNSSLKNTRYQGYKNRMYKAGSEMDNNTVEKTGSAAEIAKNVLGYGGKTPSLLGLLVAGAIPVGLATIAAPSLRTSGEKLNRHFYGVSDRINAEDEVAKKELGMSAMHHMDSELAGMQANRIKMRDLPILEQNFQSIMQSDPLVSELISINPDSAARLRETYDTVYRYAPDLATNRLAASAILREAAMSPDGGLDYQTVKLLADTQKSIGG